MSEWLIVLGHGSRRAEANAELVSLKDMVAEILPQVRVSEAFVEFAAPLLEERVGELVGLGARSIVVVPVFLTVGNHLAQGLPKRLQALEEQYAGLTLCLARHLGADRLLAQLIAERAQEALDEAKKVARCDGV